MQARDAQHALHWHRRRHDDETGTARTAYPRSPNKCARSGRVKEGDPVESHSDLIRLPDQRSKRRFQTSRAPEVEFTGDRDLDRFITSHGPIAGDTEDKAVKVLGPLDQREPASAGSERDQLEGANGVD